MRLTSSTSTVVPAEITRVGRRHAARPLASIPPMRTLPSSPEARSDRTQAGLPRAPPHRNGWNWGGAGRDDHGTYKQHPGHGGDRERRSESNGKPECGQPTGDSAATPSIPRASGQDEVSTTSNTTATITQISHGSIVEDLLDQTTSRGPQMSTSSIVWGSVTAEQDTRQAHVSMASFPGPGNVVIVCSRNPNPKCPRGRVRFRRGRLNQSVGGRGRFGQSSSRAPSTAASSVNRGLDRCGLCR